VCVCVVLCAVFFRETLNNIAAEATALGAAFSQITAAEAEHTAELVMTCSSKRVTRYSKLCSQVMMIATKQASPTHRTLMHNSVA